MAKTNELPWKNAGDFTSWDFKELGKGAVIKGIYTAKKEHVGENDSTVYTLLVGEDMIDVWGSTLIDIRLSRTEIGEEIQITYLGTKDSLKRKGKQYHDFEVLHRKVAFEPVDDKINIDDIDLSDLDTVK